MRNKVLIGMALVVVVCILGICGKVEAAAGITYYTRGAMIIENTENIKIQEYDTVINTEKSTVEETVLFANMAKEDTVTEIRLPLEDKDLGIAVKDLEVKVNNLKINNITKNDKGEYVFKVKINAGEGKKIEIYYTTENNLRDAKIIKYNFSNIDLNDRSIGKLKFDIVFPEEDIPLVTEIYPGHYTFDNNTVTVEYYNFTINSLTENILIEKDTYSSLFYDRESSFESNIDSWQYCSEEEKEEFKKIAYEFLINVPKYIQNIQDIKFDYTDHYNYDGVRVESYMPILEFAKNVFGLNSSFFQIQSIYNLVRYILNKFYVVNNSYDKILLLFSEGQDGSPLVLKYKLNNWKEKENFNSAVPLKNICIDFNLKSQFHPFYEKIYIDSDAEISTIKFVLSNELRIYQRDYVSASYYFEDKAILEVPCNLIYIGKYGNIIINATEREKAEYANMINADMYIKFDLEEKEKHMDNRVISELRYYGAENKVLADAFQKEAKRLWYWDDSLLMKESKNDELLKLVDIPILLCCEGYIYREEDKFLAVGIGIHNTLFYAVFCNEVLKTDRAKELIEANHSKNDRTKQMMEKKIGDLIITNDVEEYKEIEEILPVENEEILVENDKSEENANVTDIIVLSLIGVGLIACIIVVVIDIKRKM